MDYKKQVVASHYHGGAYRFKDRWLSYWYQLQLIRFTNPKSVLEVGPGGGVVTRELRNAGVNVTTCDIADDLHPDVIASVTKLPFTDNEFDVAVACEVLEHIEFKDFSQALSELRRVSKKYVVISLPHPGWMFSIVYKIPLFKRAELFFQIPFFWKEHKFNGEHYWELGKKNYGVRKILKAAQAAGLELIQLKKYADDPAHRFFLFKKI